MVGNHDVWWLFPCKYASSIRKTQGGCYMPPFSSRWHLPVLHSSQLPLQLVTTIPSSYPYNRYNHGITAWFQLFLLSLWLVTGCNWQGPPWPRRQRSGRGPGALRRRHRSARGEATHRVGGASGGCRRSLVVLYWLVRFYRGYNHE